MKVKPFKDVIDGEVLGYGFVCPGCKNHHQIYTQADPSSPSRHVWGFNNNLDLPTFTPSLLVTSGHYVRGHQGRCWCNYHQENNDPKAPTCFICHSFITDGKIQFLSDCTHELAGQTVELSEICEKESKG